MTEVRVDAMCFVHLAGEPHTRVRAADMRDRKGEQSAKKTPHIRYSQINGFRKVVIKVLIICIIYKQ